MDTRAYVFSYIKKSFWGFIAIHRKYETYRIPLEKWINKGQIYTISRICYTKNEAAELIKQANNPLNKNIIPHLFHVTDEHNNILLIRNISENNIEFLYKDGNILMDINNMNFNIIKNKIIEILKLNDVTYLEAYVENEFLKNHHAL
jgi:hypothetical protein